MPIEYSQRERSYELYRKGKQEGTWDPDDYDLSQDREDWREFSEEEQMAFLATASGFYDGEEDVTRTLAPYMMALDALDDGTVTFDAVQEEMYLAQQVYEEAKHTDFFSRYYEEVFGTQDTAPYREGGYQESGYSTDDLYDTADDLREAVNDGDQTGLVHALADGYLSYMGVIEAQLARSGYMSFDQMAQLKAEQLGRDEVLPGFQAGIGKVRQDETRHIENGRWVMMKLAESHPEVVEEVYEPRFTQYIENRIVNAEPQENPFDGYDGRKIARRSIQHLQDTIDYIGAEKFDRLGDVSAAIESMRERAAASDDD